MPYVFTTPTSYKDKKYLLLRIDELIQKFPFLENKIVSGKIVSVCIDGKITKINKGFKCKIFQSDNYFNAEIQEPNPLKERGVPPCEVLAIFYKYEENQEGKKIIELPIMEEMLLKGGSYSSYFDDEIKRLFKEEEIGIMLESIVFHPQVSLSASFLRDAFSSFEQEIFSSTKTSCRKILENLRQIIGSWKSIDESSSIYEKFDKIVGSLYSFSSIGGPHLGVTTREETDLILKSTYAILLYVNSILKNDRFQTKNNH